MRLLYTIVLYFGLAQVCIGQIDTNVVIKLPTEPIIQTDTFYNKGKVVAKKAMRKSMFIPGWGQLYNYKLVVEDIKSGQREGKAFGSKFLLIARVGAIYTTGYLLTQSYIENNNNYKMFLKELQYRRLNQGKPDPDGQLQGYRTEEELYTGKAIYKNNREVVLLSIGLVYGINIVDAFVTARLNYLNVDDNKFSFKVTPTLIQQQPMLGGNTITPGLKMSFKF